MKKIMLMGRTGSGKTTLAQTINQLSKDYKKTQTMEYYNNILDTPGEYIENVRFYNALITASFDCDVIGLVQDCTDDRCIFPPNFAYVFNKPTIGIITKIDMNDKTIDWVQACLYEAGVDKIFCVSAFDGTGIEEIKKFLDNIE
ncbi:EutP/PduV family microcompartment system protein [Crassaminicella thermophila]|nr:EutP/PduV family microcompartment system protein [Crassaminicella thermophila]